MAIRVRKLAKELERSPAEVLGLLHAIGFERYKSAEDQVPDPTVQHIRTAIRNGVQPVPVVLEGSRPGARPPGPAPKADVMAQLVPGVRPVDGSMRAAGRPAPLPARGPSAPRGEPATAAGNIPVAALAELGEQRARTLALLAELDALRAAVAEERAALRAERAALDASRQAMTGEGERLRADLAQRQAGRPAQLPTLSSVLEAQGALAPGDQERMLVPRLRRLIQHLRVADPAAVAAELAEPPAPPHPSVPADLDPEVPAGADRELGRIGERLMLLGLRRLVIVGGNPRLHKLLRDAFDPRIDLRLRPVNGRPRPRVEAESDVTRSDAVVLWGVALEPDAGQVYHTSRALVVEVASASVRDLIAALNRRLDEV